MEGLGSILGALSSSVGLLRFCLLPCFQRAKPGPGLLELMALNS